MICDIETLFYLLWDHAIWLNEVFKDEIWLFYTDGLFGLISVDSGSDGNDDHCEECKNEFLIFKFALNKGYDYLAAVCSPQKLRRIQNDDLPIFKLHCVLFGDIINQPDVCFGKMKEKNERNN